MRIVKHILPAFIFVLWGVLALGPSVYADPSVDVHDLNLGLVGEDDFLAGHILIPGLPVHWQSDVPWRLLVSSVDPDLGPSDDAAYVKPLDDFLWKLSEDENWTPMSQYPEEVYWSTETGSGVIYVDVAVRLDWLSDAPGDYHADLIFTVEPL